MSCDQENLIFKNYKNGNGSDAVGQKSLIFKNNEYMMPSLERNRYKNIYCKI